MVWKRSIAKGVFFTTRPVIFTSDARYICGCSGNSIKIYGVQSGEEVRSLQDHSAEVTEICLNPQNPFQILSSSLDGTIKVWDMEKATVEKTIQVGLPIYRMQLNLSGDLAFIVTDNINTEKTHMKQVLWKVILPTSEKSIIYESSRKFFGMSVSASGNTLAAICGGRALMWKIHEGYKRTLLCETHHDITAVAIHPQDEFIATADSRGEITLWYHRASKAGGKTKTKTLLWHTRAVRGLSFTTDGVYLLSGGAEGVLVTWQLETGMKQFLPGMGSRFSGITVSSDSTYYCLALKDNSLKIINAISSSPERSIQGFKHGPKQWEKPMIMVEPRNHLVVTNSLLGSLQFYNPLTDRFSFELMIALPSAESIKHSISSKIDFFAFSRDGTHLATVERKGENTSLKLWFLKTQENKWMLNTSVDGPHQDSQVTSLSSHPEIDMFVTTSSDGKFKVWSKITLTPGQASSERKRATGQNHSWVCRSVGFHAKQPATCSAFSDDGSILAIGYPDTLTLWNPQKNSLIHELPHTPQDPIRRVAFISNSPFVVTCTDHFMNVWNLLHSCIWWSYRAHVTSIATEPNSSRFVVSVSEKAHNLILLFKSDSPIPLHTWRVSDPPAAVAFFSKVALDAHQSSATGTIVYVNTHQNVHILEEYNIETQINALRISNEISLDDVIQKKPLGEEEVSLLGRLYGVSKTLEKKGNKSQASEAVPVAPADTQRALSLLNAPSHILPPLSSLYSSFMEILVKKQELNQNTSRSPKIESKKETGTNIQNEEERAPSLQMKAIEGLHNKFMEDITDFFKKNMKISAENGKTPKKPRKAESLVIESPLPEERNSKKVRNSQEMNGNSHVTVEEMLEEEENSQQVKTPKRSTKKVANGKSSTKKSEANGVDSPKLSQEEPSSPTESQSYRKRKLKPESKQNES